MCSSDGNVAQAPKQTDNGPTEQETSIDEILGLQVGVDCSVYILLKTRHVRMISYRSYAELLFTVLRPETAFLLFLFICFTVYLSLSKS